MTNPSKIGRYEIIERVGRGGMGVLYRGRDTVLDREVAIKVMSTEFDADSDDTARPRFYREARAAAKLQHRNIVTIFEFGEEDHTPFIVMEFLRGQDLSKRMRGETPLTLEEKLDIVADLCAGLHFAHEQGVVHRDVKPANIWIQTDGSIKLLDFGIAKFASSTMTRQGAVLGSISYMAPEQITGGDVDGRADIFSTGVVLHELLTGKKPFEGDSATAVLARIMDDRPAALDQLGPDVPKPLVAALAKALQKDREKRYRHAADFGADLRLVRSALTAFEPLTMDIDLTRLLSVDRDGSAYGPTVHTADPAGAVEIATSETPRAAGTPTGLRRYWWLPAAAAFLLIAVASAAYFMRPAAGPPGNTSVAGDRAAAPAPQQPGAPAATASQRAAADPAAKRPAVTAVQRGLRPPASSPKTGAGSEPLAAAPPGSPSAPIAQPPAPSVPAGAEVVFTGGYAFEVYFEGRLVSASATEHHVRVASRQAMQLKAPEYFLDATVVVDPSTRHAQAPDLGRLQLRIPEVCSAAIGGRNLGEPPYPEMQLAAGSYRVQMTCPDGSTRNVPIVIRPGELRPAVIAK